MSDASEAKAGVVLLDRVVFHTHNVRRNLGDLRQLTASIELQGVLQPVVLERYGDMLRVRMGHRRVAAARLAGLKKIPALVHPQPLDDVEFLYLAMHENTIRRGLNSAEVRAALVALKELGCTAGDIAANLGVSPATVNNWVRVEPTSWAERRQRGHVAPGRRVPLGRLREVLTAWERDLRAGLTPDQGHALAGEARGAGLPRRAHAGVEQRPPDHLEPEGQQRMTVTAKITGAAATAGDPTSLGWHAATLYEKPQPRMAVAELVPASLTAILGWVLERVAEVAGDERLRPVDVRKALGQVGDRARAAMLGAQDNGGPQW